jgi:drug/metabolite transporter (DMT)-like permease
VTGRPTVPLARGRTLALLAVGVVAVSVAAPLMAWLTVPALAIAFWRNGLASLAIAPVAGRRMIQEPARRPVRGELVLVVAAGLCLALHFGAWVTSLGMTSVASSTAIVSLQVIWVVGLDIVRGIPVRRAVVLGVLIATAGAIVVGGVDLSISSRALAGDALALVGSVAVAAYAVIGGRVRQRLSTSVYTLGCYGTAALALLVAAVVAGQPLSGYTAEQWVGLLVLTGTAQLLGHSVFNYLLATVSPTVVSMALLLEIPGAALIAAAWLGQVPGPTAFVGLVLILAGMVSVIRSAPASAAEEAVVA